jgi:hypothetical protein
MTTTIATDVETLCRQLEALQTSMSHTLAKDVSLVAGMKEWSGDAKSKSVRESCEQTESFVKISGCTEQDIALITKTKLQGLALQFVSEGEELLKDTCSYVAVKRALIERFTEKMPDQYYYNQLQDATQDRGETAEMFADRCRKLCRKTITQPHKPY